MVENYVMGCTWESLNKVFEGVALVCVWGRICFTSESQTNQNCWKCLRDGMSQRDLLICTAVEFHSGQWHIGDRECGRQLASPSSSSLQAANSAH